MSQPRQAGIMSRATGKSGRINNPKTKLDSAIIALVARICQASTFCLTFLAWAIILAYGSAAREPELCD